MSTREIITLQFGHYANFVGTHLWNIQEQSFEYNSTTPSEINHDVLFREGIDSKGQVTYTPRALLVDLKGSLKHLPQRGTLYDNDIKLDEAAVAWYDDLVEVKKDDSIKKNQYQTDLDQAEPTQVKKEYNLDDDVEVWTDYLYTRFHPRTVNVINEYEHKCADPAFDVFPLGSSLWKSDKFLDDFADRIRNYVEECDSFQGFQVLSDSTDGFAGLSTSCIEYISDEYENKSIFALPIIPSYFSEHLLEDDENTAKSIIKDSTRVLNLALCYDSLSQNSSLFVPLCTGSKGWRQPGLKREFYHTVYNEKLYYHSSAILASAIDTFSLKYRLKSNSYSLTDLCADLSPHRRKLAAASVCLPFSLNKDAELIDCLDQWEGQLSKSITPSCTIGTERNMQLITLRGVPESRLKKPHQKAGQQKAMAAYNCNNIKEMVSLYMSCTCPYSATDVTTFEKGLKVTTPYPKIFDQYVGIDGNIHADARLPGVDVQSVPVLSGLHSTSTIGDMLENLHTQARKIKFARFHQFKTAGLETDEFNECLDRLFDLRECYEDNYLI